MSTSKRPNILLIQTDQQTAETLRLYGNPIVRTPNLDRLAERGIVFEHAFSNYPACAPSRSSMHTGMYASSIHCHANHMLINPDLSTLPGQLKASGYQTAIVGKNHAFMNGQTNYYPGSRNGQKVDLLHEVFDFVRLGEHGHWVQGCNDDPEVQAAHQWAKDNCWSSPLGHGTNPASYKKCGTYLLGETAERYLEQERNPDQPFFLFLSFPDPHTPYQAPEPYASMYDPKDVPLPPKDTLAGKPERQKVAHLMDAMDMADDDLIRKVRAIHYGMITFIDDAIGRVFSALERLGLADDTVVVFTSDHGDSMGAHGLIQKHNGFYDSFTHVPFIVSVPGQKARGRTSNMVELVDVMATLLELAGAEIPAHIQGRSLAPFLLGESFEPRDFVVIESGEEGEPPRVSEITVRPESPFDDRYFVWCAYREAWFGKGKSIRTREWKLNLYTNGDGELYNLKDDPHELNNLYGDPAWNAVVSELQHKLILWSMAKEERLPANHTVKHHYRDLVRG